MLRLKPTELMSNKSYKTLTGLVLERVESDDKSDENYSITRNMKKNLLQLSVLPFRSNNAPLQIGEGNLIQHESRSHHLSDEKLKDLLRSHLEYFAMRLLCFCDHHSFGLDKKTMKKDDDILRLVNANNI
jgi:hypothetical protein